MIHKADLKLRVAYSRFALLLRCILMEDDFEFWLVLSTIDEMRICHPFWTLVAKVLAWKYGEQIGTSSRQSLKAPSGSRPPMAV